MWIVRYALSRTYSIGVLAILLVLVGTLSARRMSTDILPSVDTPSVSVIWTYSGLNAREMAAKIASFGELVILNNVDDVLEVRSETTDGVTIIKVDFQPYVELSLALTQINSVSQTILRRMPTGTSPPLIVRNSASSQPVLNLVLSSDTLDDSALYDFARLQLRGQIQTIPGVRMSLPYGGASRQVMVDLDPGALQTFGLTASEVSAAVSAQNLTLPSGTLREGRTEYKVAINASPSAVADFAELPIRQVDGRVVRLGDVASVRDGPAVQTNLARLNGANAVQVSMLKLGGASTVDIVDQILARLPEIRATAPPGMRIEPLFDQSVFVRAAVRNVLHEGVLVGLLVASVVLLFIGSLRSTLVVLTSIPLALLGSVAALHATGQTFNLMTLGGLGLAIGILVDNALVEIENCNRRIAAGEPVREAILNSAGEVVFPEFVSTLCICIVFLPIFLLTGVPAYVFKPMACAVVFAMIGSFLLSRTLVPCLAYLLIPGELRRRGAHGLDAVERVHHHVERALDAVRDRYVTLLQRLALRTWLLWIIVLATLGVGVIGARQLEQGFFPRTDAGLMRLHVRAPTGTRLEETARLFSDVQLAIRRVVPAHEIDVITEVIGQPEPVNLAWIDSAAAGSFDGEIDIELIPGHAPITQYQAALRRMLAADFPQLIVFFRPADTTALTLAGASPTDLDFRVVGRDVPGNREAAASLMAALKKTPGVEDVTLRQVFDLPQMYIEVDRTRALQLGVTYQQVASAVLSVLGTSGTVSPSFWADPANGNSYSVQVIATPLSLDSVQTLMNTPVRLGATGQTVLLGSVATVKQRRVPAGVTRVTLAPTLNVLANLSTEDLGGVLRAIEPTLVELRAGQKPGNKIELRGQGQTMNQAYGELASGLLLAIVLVFLVQAVNFQSWLLPLNAMAALPLALTGAVLGLWLTRTPLSVPALMGMIMVVGVSTANSVLITSFARDRVAEGCSPRDAALAAARTRLRPVLMTATAMILGVLPMALGLGEGGEQNAPLGRAVIGGLLLGTLATLVLVPLLFTRLGRPRRAAPAEAVAKTTV
jgi:multidrug efflux pump subunit AcrB